MSFNSNANLFHIINLIIILIFSSKFFESTPVEDYFFQAHALFLCCTLIFIFIYISDKMVKREKLDFIMAFYIFLIFFMPIYSSLRSNSVFGQPIIYGVLVERTWVLIGVGIYFDYILRTKKYSIDSFEFAFLCLAWFSLITFSLFYLFVTPDASAVDNSLIINSEDRGVRFKFQGFFIMFGVLYYLVKHHKVGGLNNLFYCFLFILYVVFFEKSRTNMSYIFFTIIIFYMFNTDLRVFFSKICKFICFMLLLFIVIDILNPSYIDTMLHLFSDMISALGGIESTDSSSNARILQFDSVINFFQAQDGSMLFGTGRISNQWNDGYKSIFDYFYPEDIGVIGGVFLYGIVGVLLLMFLSVFFIFKEIRIVNGDLFSSDFMLTIKYLLVMSLIKYLQSGLYFGPNIWLLILFILYSYNRVCSIESVKISV